ncbi:endolytic transglycosylase MltG [Microbacterium sp.]|uniref:endolytic transglycosylase MltG n=1 Tax=Microbacterium sp. TaxID=51671 RepID=UPI0039E47682
MPDRSPQEPASDDEFADLFQRLPTSTGGGASATPAHDSVRAARRRRVARRRRLVAFVVLLVLVALAGWAVFGDRIRDALGWNGSSDYAAGMEGDEVFVTVVAGDTGESISATLYEAGVTKTEGVFYEFLLETKQNPAFEPGVFALHEKMTAEAALAAILDPDNRRESEVQLREGLTVAQTLTRIEEATGIPLADLEAATADPSRYGVDAQSLEGWLFPATYDFDPGVTAETVIRTLVNRTFTALDEAGVPVDDRQRILTIASIIQREARFEADFYKVSRVIVNRLASTDNEVHGMLQMDSTAQYGYGEMHDGTVSTSDEAQKDDNPWNTYVHTGLPIGPIANPGELAIDAALHPADGPWLYFVTVNLETGETVFTETYAEHLTYVEQWQQWCEANDSEDC